MDTVKSLKATIEYCKRKLDSKGGARGLWKAQLADAEARLEMIRKSK